MADFVAEAAIQFVEDLAKFIPSARALCFMVTYTATIFFAPVVLKAVIKSWSNPFLLDAEPAFNSTAHPGFDRTLDRISLSLPSHNFDVDSTIPSTDIPCPDVVIDPAATLSASHIFSIATPVLSPIVTSSTSPIITLTPPVLYPIIVTSLSAPFPVTTLSTAAPTSSPSKSDKPSEIPRVLDALLIAAVFAALCGALLTSKRAIFLSSTQFRTPRRSRPRSARAQSTPARPPSRRAQNADALLAGGSPPPPPRQPQVVHESYCPSGVVPEWVLMIIAWFMNVTVLMALLNVCPCAVEEFRRLAFKPDFPGPSPPTQEPRSGDSGSTQVDISWSPTPQGPSAPPSPPPSVYPISRQTVMTVLFTLFLREIVPRVAVRILNLGLVYATCVAIALFLVTQVVVVATSVCIVRIHSETPTSPQAGEGTLVQTPSPFKKFVPFFNIWNRTPSTPGPTPSRHLRPTATPTFPTPSPLRVNANPRLPPTSSLPRTVSPLRPTANPLPATASPISSSHDTADCTDASIACIYEDPPTSTTDDSKSWAPETSEELMRRIRSSKADVQSPRTARDRAIIFGMYGTPAPIEPDISGFTDASLECIREDHTPSTFDESESSVETRDDRINRIRAEAASRPARWERDTTRGSVFDLYGPATPNVRTADVKISMTEPGLITQVPSSVVTGAPQAEESSSFSMTSFNKATAAFLATVDYSVQCLKDMKATILGGQPSPPPVAHVNDTLSLEALIDPVGEWLLCAQTTRDMYDNLGAASKKESGPALQKKANAIRTPSAPPPSTSSRAPAIAVVPPSPNTSHEQHRIANTGPHFVPESPIALKATHTHFDTHGVRLDPVEIIRLTYGSTAPAVRDIEKATSPKVHTTPPLPPRRSLPTQANAVAGPSSYKPTERARPSKAELLSFLAHCDENVSLQSEPDSIDLTCAQEMQTCWDNRAAAKASKGKGKYVEPKEKVPVALPPTTRRAPSVGGTSIPRSKHSTPAEPPKLPAPNPPPSRLPRRGEETRTVRPPRASYPRNLPRSTSADNTASISIPRHRVTSSDPGILIPNPMTRGSSLNPRGVAFTLPKAGVPPPATLDSRFQPTKTSSPRKSKTVRPESAPPADLDPRFKPARTSSPRKAKKMSATNATPAELDPQFRPPKTSSPRKPKTVSQDGASLHTAPPKSRYIPTSHAAPPKTTSRFLAPGDDVPLPTEPDISDDWKLTDEMKSFWATRMAAKAAKAQAQAAESTPPSRPTPIPPTPHRSRPRDGPSVSKVDPPASRYRDVDGNAWVGDTAPCSSEGWEPGDVRKKLQAVLKAAKEDRMQREARVPSVPASAASSSSRPRPSSPPPRGTSSNTRASVSTLRRPGWSKA